ncbi:MAG: adenosine kinase [Alteromonadaceae bacterium]|nr:MAG: adenosine kinase [Alteromonadaceae bacterium]
MSTYDIYGIGAALVDTEIEVSDQDLTQFGIEKGVMTLVDEPRQNQLVEDLKNHLTASKRASGGSAANSIIAASYFGAQTFHSCRVANDNNGDFYLKDLSDAGVAYHQNNGSLEGITGKCLVMITPDAERTMNTFLGISETLAAEDIDVEALQASKYAYIEGYLVTSATGKPAAIKLRELAQEFGVKTALSLSDPAIVEYFHAGLQEIIGDGVDIIFCNEDEAMNFTKTDSLDAAFEALKQHAKSFAITRGSEGASLFDGEQRIEIDSHPVKAVDTNGAGDMFAGAFLYAISKGLSYEQAGELASEAASIVVSQFGPRLKAEQHVALLEG